MKLTQKNLAKFRREVKVGDQVTYLGTGSRHREETTDTVGHAGNREPDGFLLVMHNPRVVEYYSVVAWVKA